MFKSQSKDDEDLAEEDNCSKYHIWSNVQYDTRDFPYRVYKYEKCNHVYKIAHLDEIDDLL